MAVALLGEVHHPTTALLLLHGLRMRSGGRSTRLAGAGLGAQGDEVPREGVTLALVTPPRHV